MSVNPKLFVSYSWGSQAHQEWVLQLATELMQSGVDVVIDKWDLKEGHDAHVFMERMVTDPTITHVALIFDETYARKADERSGGVGIETQVITADVYNQAEQSKFVALVREVDDEGKPYRPAYYKSRIYIDFTDDQTYADAFEQLLRWAFSQPLHKKPALGAKPSFLAEDAHSISMATSASFKRAIMALRAGRPFATAAASEALDIFAAEVEKFRVTDFPEPYDDALFNQLPAFLPYRDELIQLVLALSQYDDTPETRVLLHRFIESLAKYGQRPNASGSYRTADFDIFKFIAYEIFVHTIAIYIRLEKFEAIPVLTGRFFVEGHSDYGRDAMVPFSILAPGHETFDFRNRRLKLNRLSLIADTVKARCESGQVSFRQFMQADLVLYIRGLREAELTSWWWPHSLVYSSSSGPMELFARSMSTSYFNRMKVCIGYADKAELVAQVESLEQNPSSLPRWQYDRLAIRSLTNIKNLATHP